MTDSPFDLERARRDTPGCQNIVHFNNAGASWMHFYAGKIGLGVAIDYALGWGIGNTWPRVRPLAEELRARLLDLGFVTVHDLGRERCGIVTFRVRGVDSEVVKGKLLAEGINVSVSFEENSRTDLGVRGIPDMVRASVHYYNTDGEIDRLCGVLAKLFAKQREY